MLKTAVYNINNGLLLFLLVHSFYLYPPINSSFLVPVLTIVLSIFYNRNFLSLVWRLINNKKVINLYLYIFSIFTFSFIIPILHGTFDFSYSKNFISQIIQLIFILFVSGFIFNSIKQLKEKPSEYIEKLIVWIFIAQSCVEILAFLFPQIAAFVHLFYRAEVVETIYDNYDGIRGLALTGSPGWGISVGYGLSFLFYAKVYIIDEKISLKAIFFGCLLVLGTFFAGRSGFVGAILAVFFYLFSHRNFVFKIKNLLYGFILLLFSILLIYVLVPNFIILLIERVFPFVFEFYFKYESTGIIQTSSTNRLRQMWSIDIDSIVYFIGSGYFTDPVTGAYYGRVDVGYLRNILFGGLPWVFVMIFYQFYVGAMEFTASKKINIDKKTFICFLFFIILIFDAKAMAVGFLKYSFTILLLYHFSLIYEYDIILNCERGKN